MHRLAATLYAYTFLDDLVLLYPVYTLLFADHGLTDRQLSSLFIVWAATGILLEVPSGVWADTRSRRPLLYAGPALTAAGFALWVLAPSYPVFALGFVLWGAKGAFTSGALEALVYDELARLGAAARYARMMGRARAAGVSAVLIATVGAAPVLAAGGYPAVAAASVLACALTGAAGACLPEHRPTAETTPPRPHPTAETTPTRPRSTAETTPTGHPPAAVPSGAAAGTGRSGQPPADDAGDGTGGHLATLWAGLSEARADPAVRRWVLVVPAVTAGWGALEEYTPLLVRDTGVATATVPLLLALIWAGVTAGGLLAGAGRRLSTTGLAALVAAAALALAAGAVGGHPAGIGLVAAAFGAFQVATVLADVRLQDSMTGANRATVTSLASLGTDLTTIGWYAGYALLAPAGHRTVFALAAVPYLLLAAVLTRSPGAPGR